VVQKNIFFANQFPYLEVRRPFILGVQAKQWKATLSHWFFKFLADDGILTRIFTQNIDGMDYQSGIDPSLVCNVHGSIGVVKCEFCGRGMSLDDFCDELRRNIKDIYGVDPAAPKESSHILCPSCSKPTLKPNTVLFGSSLPADFFDLADRDLPTSDLLIVAGTSLVVSPANSVVQKVSRDCPRLIVNNERVGQDLGIVYGAQAKRDIYCGRPCDEVFLDLMLQLGWRDRVLAIREQLPPDNQLLFSQLGL